MADSLFGHVLECSRENHNSIVLNPVSIGEERQLISHFDLTA